MARTEPGSLLPPVLLLLSLSFAALPPTSPGKDNRGGAPEGESSPPPG